MRKITLVLLHTLHYKAVGKSMDSTTKWLVFKPYLHHYGINESGQVF